MERKTFDLICRSKPVAARLLSMFLVAGLAGAEPAPPTDEAVVAYKKGLALQSGKGSPTSPADARKEFEKAAAGGHSLAAVQLGVLLANGTGGPKDDASALKYFDQAARAGQKEALYNKGLFLLQGRGAPRDTKAGLESLAAAAAAGSIPAHVKLADLYYFGGEGIEKDHLLARPHVEAAAVSGDAWACNILGTMAELGQAMKRDRNLARHWFTLAAEKGNAKAQGNVGRLLRQGKPTDHEKVECFKWLKLSSLQGISMSTYLLDAHRRSMTPVQIARAEREVLEFQKSRAGKNEGSTAPVAPPSR